MPDQLEGPALAAAVAVEVMGWEGNDLEGIWVPPGAAMVIECCPIDEWRPDSDPTTFFCDVVPAMRERHFGELTIRLDGQWVMASFGCSGRAEARGLDMSTIVATAGCLAALAAVRSRKAAETAEEKP